MKALRVYPSQAWPSSLGTPVPGTLIQWSSWLWLPLDRKADLSHQEMPSGELGAQQMEEQDANYP